MRLKWTSIGFVGLVLLLWVVGLALVDTVEASRGIPATPGQKVRFALVIGNNNCHHVSRLDNPVNDARDMTAKLKKLGFEVLCRYMTQTKYDANQETMENAINTFSQLLRSSHGTGLFFYAGHGVQVDGENYLVPVDANVQASGQVRYKTVAAGYVLASMEEGRTTGEAVNIIILDACRDNPFHSFRSAGTGLAPLKAQGGSFIAFATGPGQKAADGTGDNGTFTSAVENWIDG